MELIIKRAYFNADDFNSELNCRQYACAKNFNGYVAIEVADHCIADFKETLRSTYAYLDSEHEVHSIQQQRAAELERRQMMIRQIITKIFKP